MPLMSDAACLATLDVLTRIFAPAGVTDTNLMALVACRAVSLSLEHGNCDASCAHYAWLGRVTGGRFDDYQLALRFGRLACDLIDRYGLTRFQSAVYLAVGGNIVPWVKHVRAGRELIQRASEAASRTGDLVFEAYSLIHLNANALMAGDPLADVQRQVEASLDAARRMKFRFAADVIGGQLAYVRTLRGSTRAFGSLDDQEFDEAAAERAFAGNPDLAGLGGPIGSESCRHALLRGTTRRPSTQDQGQSGSYGHSQQKAPTRNFISTVRCLSQPVVAAPQAKQPMPALSALTTISFGPGNKIVLRILSIVPRWLAPKSPGLRDVKQTRCTYLNMRSGPHRPTALFTMRQSLVNWQRAFAPRAALTRSLTCICVKHGTAICGGVPTRRCVNSMRTIPTSSWKGPRPARQARSVRRSNGSTLRRLSKCHRRSQARSSWRRCSIR
jgi:hypothetical protein